MNQKASTAEKKSLGESFAKDAPDSFENELSVEELASITGGAIVVEARGKKGK